MIRMWWPRRKPRVFTDSNRTDASDERNRFLAARHEFANAFGDLARGKRNWQVMAFSLAGLLAAVTVAYVRLASSARLVPYVVQVDRVGQVVAAGLVGELHDPDQRLVASQLAHFIRSIRTVLPAAAAAAQADLVRQAYAFLGPEAAGFLNDYFANPDNDPRTIGARLTRLVTVTSVLRVPGSDVWKLRWTEEERPLQGGWTARNKAWEGYLTVRVAAPRSADAIEANPLGLTIESLTWTEIAEAPASSLGGGTP